MTRHSGHFLIWEGTGRFQGVIGSHDEGVDTVNQRSLAPCMLFLLLFLAGGCLLLGSVRDVQCEVLDATNTSGTVTVRFVCLHEGWVPLSEVKAEVRMAEKDQEVGGGWYTAGKLIATRVVEIGTIEPGMRVEKEVQFTSLNWSRDPGIRIRLFQS